MQKNLYIISSLLLSWSLTATSAQGQSLLNEGVGGIENADLVDDEQHGERADEKSGIGLNGIPTGISHAIDRDHMVSRIHIGDACDN